MEKFKYDVVCLTEHWQRDYEVCAINYENYYVASLFSRRSAIHGGSLILLRKNIISKQRNDIVGMSVEQIVEMSCVELEEHIVMSVYRPPYEQNFSTFESVMEDVLRILFKSNKKILVCGDFNVNILENDNMISCKFLNLFNSFNLKNVFCTPTRVTSTTSSCLDNIFCNCDILNQNIVKNIQSDHYGQEIVIPYKVLSTRIEIKTRLITQNRLQQFNENVFNQLLHKEAVVSNCTGNSLYKQMFSVLVSEFEKKFPVKKINMTCNKFKFSDWATAGIRKSRERLFELYELKNIIQTDTFKDYVRNYSKIFKKVCIVAKSNLINKKIKISDNKIKTIWNIIIKESGKLKFQSNEYVLNTSNGLISSDLEVAQEFETFFSQIPFKTTQTLNSSSTKAVALLSTHVGACEAEFKFKHTNPELIIKTFKQLKIKSTKDLWGMSVKIFTSIIGTLAPYLAVIFNKCIDEGTFPDLMKHSKLIPLFKAGDNKDPGNFRPVSVLPVLSKIFEKLILNQITIHFSVNQIFHTQQFGFTKGRSTIDAGANLVRYIFNAWENKEDAVGIFCDLSKAFDCVEHQTLLSKLHHYGIKDNALRLLHSYLIDRIQTVLINEARSTGSQVRIGVPQGSILGPFLFLVYINDLPFMAERLSNVVLFADDTSLVFKINRTSVQDNISHVNTALKQLHEWFTVNNLVLNAKKTKCIHFKLPNVAHSIGSVKINNEVLDVIENTVFLGITVDSRLQWGPHIITLSKRLSSAIYAIKKIKQLTDVHTARLVYYSYFHSVMCYGILLWGRAADIDTIFVLQKRAVRAIYGLKSRDSLRELFKTINIITVPSQYIYENIMYVRKNLSLFRTRGDIHKINTRNRNKLITVQTRLSKIQKSFVWLCTEYYNKLPDYIVNLPEHKFKAIVKKTLSKMAYYKLDDYLNDKLVWTRVVTPA